jgi:hypothetical protein
LDPLISYEENVCCEKYGKVPIVNKTANGSTIIIAGSFFSGKNTHQLLTGIDVATLRKLVTK